MSSLPSWDKTALQTEWLKLYFEYTYEQKEKTNMSSDNTRLLERI
jgi:hypothetical protein